MPYIDRAKTRPGTTRRVRMLGHDYSSPGYYFLTVCTDKQQRLFGEIANDEMILSHAGLMLGEVIEAIESKFKSVSVDCSVVMPNHLHLLVGISVRLSDEQNSEAVGDVVRWLKNSSVRRYGVGVREQGWIPYDGRLWQKSYHDHIVRNEKELETLRAYIANNVYMWKKDKFYDW